MNGCDFVVTVDCNCNRGGGTSSEKLFTQFSTSVGIMMVNNSVRGIELSDLIICPDLKKYKSLSLDGKDEMIKERENIHNLLVQYLNANDYKINVDKSKNVYALDSIVTEYEDIRGNIDNIKIEINYMNRVHILETKQLKMIK